jgi:hydrogenase-4 component F
MILAALLLVPLAGGLLSYLGRRRAVFEALHLACAAAVLALAVILAGQVSAKGPVSLWNGLLYADHLSALVILLTASVTLPCAVYAVGYLRRDESNGALPGDEDGGALPMLRRYYALTPLFLFSMILVALANNLGVMWVAIEATTLTSVFLVAFYGKATSLEAAWKYAIIGGVGLSMALFGTVLTYYSGHALAGADTLAGLNWSFLAEHAAHLDRTTMRLAFILALLGYGTKAGLAPMHTWKPDAYGEAPVPAAAILSTAMLNCALYGLVRFMCRQPRAGAGLSRRSADAVRHPFDGNLGSLRADPKELPPPAGVPHHRSRRHHGHRHGHRRKARHAGADAAHDVSHRRQVFAVPVRATSRSTSGATVPAQSAAE